MKSKLKLFVVILVIANFIFTPLLYALDEAGVSSGKESTISMDLQDASLKDVLKILSIQSSLNFVASEAVQDRKLTLYMDKVPLKEAMDKIFKANNLVYDLDKEASIFIVKDWGKPSVETITEVFYLKHAMVSSSSLKEEEKNIMSGTADTSTGSSSGSSGSSSSSGSSGSSSSSGSGSGGSSGKWQAESESGITAAVKKLLTKDGTVIEDFRTNSLIVSDIPIKMEVIRRVISSLDISVPQVILEVEILDVSKDIVDKIGFKFGQTPLSVAITGSTAGLGFPYQSWSKLFRNAADAAVGASSNGGISINPSPGYTAQLDFLRTQTDTKFLARPKILTLNNETAEIKITTNEAIGVSSAQEGTGTSSSTTVTAERYETGVSLRVTPQVDLTTGEITMFVFPKVSEAGTTAASFTAPGSGGATATYTFLNPETRSTKSTVRIKDGDTVVLGGLIRNQNTTVITKLPFLGDIPFLGALFRHKSQSPGKDRELLVFITPRIIKDSGAMDKKSEDIQPAKKLMLPAREQSAASVISRQSTVNTYLNTLEKQH